jgi:hypothetical protein
MQACDDVLASSEVIDRVQALKDHAERDDRSIERDDYASVQRVNFIERADCVSEFWLRF